MPTDAMKYYVQQDGEWFQPCGNYRMACCDCGLVHRFQFRIRDGKIQFRAWRDARSTAQKRRHLLGASNAPDAH